MNLSITPVENEPRIHDLALAEALEYANPTKIRELIKRHAESLAKLGVLPTVGKTSSAVGGRPTDEFYLNKAQAIFITTQAGTAKAVDVTVEVVKRFDEYESGKRLPAAHTNRNTSRFIASEMKGALALARMVGYEGNQALLAADKCVARMHGVSPLALIGAVALPSPANEALLTPTELGARVGLSAVKLNLLLDDLGLQTPRIGRQGGRAGWSLTDEGRELGVYLDTGKQHSDGSPVQQIKWRESVLAQIGTVH